MSAAQTERERALGALVELSAERGYRNLDLLSVLERASLSEAQFQRHFANLEDCFCVAVEQGTQRLLGAVGAAYQGLSGGWRSQLRALAYALLDFLQADPAWARLMVVEVPGTNTRAEAARDFGMTALAAFLDLARAELPDPDSVPPTTAEATAAAIYSRIHGSIEASRFDREGEQMVCDLMYTAVLPYMGRRAALEELCLPPRGAPRGRADR